MHLLHICLITMTMASLEVNASFGERFENWVREFKQEFHNTDHHDSVMRKWIENDKYMLVHKQDYVR